MHTVPSRRGDFSDGVGIPRGFSRGSEKMAVGNQGPGHTVSSRSPQLQARLRSPRSTQELSTRSLGLLNVASEVGLSRTCTCVISGAFVEEKPSSNRPELGLKKKGLRGGDAAVGGDDDGRCVDVDCHRLPLCQQHRESHNKIAATPSAFLETSTWILEAIAYHCPRAPAPLDPCCCPPPESALELPSGPTPSRGPPSYV